ncbi:MAG: hypothetical protein KF773_24645 [Deltaproteobacteria bacterium]|nr:hypothetical protein [Deltaproteobacteria bacterium]
MWYCARPSLESPIILPRADEYRGWETIERLIALAVDVQLNVAVEPMAKWEQTLSRDLWGAMGQIWLRQYIVQRRSPYRIGQALLMYRDAPLRRQQRDPAFSFPRFQAALQRVLGAGLEHFLFVLMQAAGRASGNHPALSHTTLAPVKDRRYDRIVGSIDDRGMYSSAYDGFFRALSATPEAMMQWSRERLRDLDPDADELRVRFDGPNPLSRYPLVRCFPDKSDHCIAPIPHLIQEWLYEPLMDLLARELGTTTQLGQNVGAALFEEYIGALADLCSPNGPGWVHESAMQPALQGRKVVDWARELNGHLVLLDAKRGYVEPSARGRWDPGDWTSIKKAIVKGVTQACSFWTAIKAGEVPALLGTTASPIAVVVTQGDSTFYNSTETWRTEVDNAIAGLPDVVPWTVMSLDVYENVMTTWRGRDDAWLPALLMRTTQERSHKAFAELPLLAEGPLWEAQSTFIRDQIGNAGPDRAKHFTSADE